MEGKLASISGTNLTVTSWGGNWNVDASSAKLARRFGGASNLTEFLAGDSLTIIGTVATTSSWTIKAKAVRNEFIQVKNANFSDTISNLSASGFTLTTTKQTIQVTVDSNTKVRLDNKTSTFASLTNGMTAQVKGVWNRTQSTVMASNINAHSPKATE